MNIDNLIADLERALPKATPGPWFALTKASTLQVSIDEEHTNKSAVVHWMGFDSSDQPKYRKRANAELIALCSPTNIAALLAEVKRLRSDAERYRWLVNFATSWDGTADSDNMVRLWFYRPDRREVMVVGINLDDAIELAEKERQAVAAVPGHELNYGQRTR